jgi:hypothetical protein
MPVRTGESCVGYTGKKENQAHLFFSLAMTCFSNLARRSRLALHR